MEDKLQKERHFLKFMINTNEKQQKMLIKNLTKSQLAALIEVIYNAIRGNLVIPEKDKKNLKRYRHVIRKVISKRLSQKRRKAILLKYFKQFLALIKPSESWLKN